MASLLGAFVLSAIILAVDLRGAVAMRIKPTEHAGLRSGEYTHASVKPDLSWAKKGSCADQVKALLGKMSLQEQYSQLTDGAASIPRLGVPAMSWWSEGIHGLMSDQAQGGTLYPTPLTLGASWDPTLAKRMGQAVALEALAYETQARKSKDAPYRSIHLNLFAPNINLLRDPRWGRASETYGEDPAHMAEMATGYVTGVQGDDPAKLRVGATCKHYAVHSLEASDGITRHNQDAEVDDRDLAESYLPAFEACVGAGARSVMCSYNRVNGVPACANAFLLNETLRANWGFTGFVTSDCWAVSDIPNAHHYVPPGDTAAAVALSTAAGCDMTCGGEAAHLGESVVRGLINQAQVKEAAERVLLERCQRKALTFDLQPHQEQQPRGAHNEHDVAGDDGAGGAGGAGEDLGRGLGGKGKGAAAGKGWEDVPLEVIGSPEHLELAREIQRKSLVLLVNRPVPSVEAAAALKSPASSTSRLLRARREEAARRRQQRDAAASGEGGAAQQPAQVEDDRPLLPLDLAEVKRVLVLGALSDAKEHLLGTYYNKPSAPVVSVLDALRGYFASKAPGVEVQHENVFDTLLPGSIDWMMGATDQAADADLVVVVVGSSSVGQQSSGPMVTPVFETEGLDRDSIRLQGKQQELVLAAARAGTPVVVVVVHGGPIDVSPLLSAPAVGAVISMGFPGQQGTEVLPPLLFGEFSPSGRVSVTWQFSNYTELSAMSNMAMREWPGRTYKYLQVPALFELGHGLSYIQWQYTNTSVRPCSQPELLKGKDSSSSHHEGLSPTHTTLVRSSLTGAVSRAVGCLSVGFSLTNAGPMDGDEVVVLLAERGADPLVPDGPPRKQLVGFQRLSIPIGRTVRISFQLSAAHLAHADSNGEPALDLRQPVRLRVGRAKELLPLELSGFSLEPPVPRSRVASSRTKARSMPLLADLRVEDVSSP